MDLSEEKKKKKKKKEKDDEGYYHGGMIGYPYVAGVSSWFDNPEPSDSLGDGADASGE